MKHALPNLLTLGRIGIIPLFIASFYLPGPFGYWSATALFLLASLSDFLDGFLARKWQVESALGAALDPIADKLLVATALIMLAAVGHAHPIPALIIILREILVSGIRECLAGKAITMPVTGLAKAKTAIQMLALLLLLASQGTAAFAPEAHSLGTGLLWLAAALTAFTGYHYLRTALPHLR